MCLNPSCADGTSYQVQCSESIGVTTFRQIVKEFEQEPAKRDVHHAKAVRLRV